MPIPVGDRTVSVVQSYNANEDKCVVIPRMYIQTLVDHNDTSRYVRSGLFPYCVLLCHALVGKREGKKRTNPSVTIQNKDYDKFFSCTGRKKTTDRHLKLLEEKGLIAVQKLRNGAGVIVYMKGLSSFTRDINAYNTERHAIYNQSGYAVLPRKIYDEYFKNTEEMGTADFAADLLFHVVYNDPDYPLSCQGNPIVVYEKTCVARDNCVQGKGITSSRSLGLDRTINQRSVSRTLGRLIEYGLIVRKTFTTYGSVIAFPGFLDMLYGYREEAAKCEKAKETKEEQFQYWKSQMDYAHVKRIRSKQLHIIWGIIKFKNGLVEQREHQWSLKAMKDKAKQDFSWFFGKIHSLAFSQSKNTIFRISPLRC